MQPQPFIDRPGGEIIGSATDNMGITNTLPSPDIDYNFAELFTGAQPRLPAISDMMARPAVTLGPGGGNPAFGQQGQ